MIALIRDVKFSFHIIIASVDKSADSIAMKAESLVAERSPSVENAGETKKEENELDDEEEEEQEKEEEEKKEQPIEKYSEIVETERQSHTDNDTVPIVEEKSAIKSALDDISVGAADEKNSSIATEKSEIHGSKPFTQEQSTQNQNEEVFMANKLAEMQFSEDTPNDDSNNQEFLAQINKIEDPTAIEPVSEDATNSDRESSRCHLQEIVSDMEESQRITNLPNMSSTITSQNNANTELFKRTSNSMISNPPSYFYQVCFTVYYLYKLYTSSTIRSTFYNQSLQPVIF